MNSVQQLANDVLPDASVRLEPVPLVPSTHQITFNYIDQQYANLNPPPKLLPQDVRKSQAARSRSSTVNVQQGSVQESPNMSLSPLDSVVPVAPTIPAPDPNRSASVEITQIEMETQPVVQAKQSSFQFQFPNCAATSEFHWTKPIRETAGGRTVPSNRS